MHRSRLAIHAQSAVGFCEDLESMLERFNISEKAALLALRLACERPACPPLKTMIVFWTRREHWAYTALKREYAVVSH